MAQGRLIDVILDSPVMWEAASQSMDARIPVATPYGFASFFVVGDMLEARVTERQADYFALIEGFEVEGREPKAKFTPNIDSWMAEGERLRRKREGNEPQRASMDPLQSLVSLLGGPEALMAALTARMPDLVQTAQVLHDAEIEEERRKIEARREARGWTHTKLSDLEVETACELLSEFDPTYNTADKPPMAIRSQVAKKANENHVLSDRLEALLEK